MELYLYMEEKGQSTYVKNTWRFTKRIHTQWYRYCNGQNPTTRILDTPPQRSHYNFGWKVVSDSQQSARTYMYGSRRISGAPTTTTQGIDQENTHSMIQVLKREKYDHRNIEYASSKVPLEIYLEGRIRQSTIYPHMYVCMYVSRQRSIAPT